MIKKLNFLLFHFSLILYKLFGILESIYNFFFIILKILIMLDEKSLDLIIQNIGQNKVIGKIEEIPEYVQGFKNEHLHNSNLSDFKCPYDIFKKYQNLNRNRDKNNIDIEKDAKNNKNDKNNKDNKDDKDSGNMLLKQIFLYIDNLGSLYSSESLKDKIEKFKKELSKHLDDEKDYFRKFGFSRKKGIDKMKMKSELEQVTTDGKLSDESLTYICKVCNINLVFLDLIKLERKDILSENSDVSAVFIIQCPDKNDVTTYHLENDGNKDRYSDCIMSLLKDKEGIVDNNSLSRYLTILYNMKCNDQKKILKFIEGNHCTKNLKKNEICDLLRKKIEGI